VVDGAPVESVDLRFEHDFSYARADLEALRAAQAEKEEKEEKDKDR
jgi:hypothetical protein